MAPKRNEPSAIRSVAVTADDVVAAVESHFQRGERVVLRVTPPFSGRMRARIHVPSAETTADQTGAVSIEPQAFLADDVPPYPRADDTEAELRADPDSEYSVERHRERHERALASWRKRVRDDIVSEVTIETSDGEHVVDVVVLG